MTSFFFISRPCILIFDSLQSCSRAKVAATLRDYLACEYREKLGKDRVFDKVTIRGCCPKVPQQPNFSDCGIFVLQYIQSFFEVKIVLFFVIMVLLVSYVNCLMHVLLSMRIGLMARFRVQLTFNGAHEFSPRNRSHLVTALQHLGLYGQSKG